MNLRVLEFVGKALPGEEVLGKRVLEVGARDVNGTPRSVIVPRGPAEYVGCDLAPGRGVDRILDAMKLVDGLGPESFDIVVSTEMLEHLEDWRGALAQMKRVLKGGGTLVLSTRSPGFPYHEYPNDCWRYTKDDMRAAFADMDILLLEDDSVQEPGVLVKARKPLPFTEADLTAVQVYRMPQPGAPPS